MIINNRVTDTLDPFEPLKPWIIWAKYTWGNDVVQKLQKTIPLPPTDHLSETTMEERSGTRIIFGTITRGSRHATAKDYFPGYFKIRLFVKDTKSVGRRHSRQREIHSSRPYGSKNIRFISYSVLWNSGYIGDVNTNKPPQPGVWLNNEQADVSGNCIMGHARTL